MHSPLTKIIQQKITQQGLITFADFMALALYHPMYGYYCQKNFNIGRQGDFITAPVLSPLFAACLASAFEAPLRTHKDYSLLELGAGTGELALQLLCTLHERNTPPKHYYIYDISEARRQAQRDHLAEKAPWLLQEITWLSALPERFSGIIFGNEVLDALPVHCFYLDEQQIKERWVGLSDAPPYFVWQEATPHAKAFESIVSRLCTTYHLPAGYASEACLALQPFMQQLADCLEAGLLLFSDYGYGESEYYHPSRTTGTLSCFYKHLCHADPFLHVGAQDITAHVNFTQVATLGVAMGLTLQGFTTQARFLIENDLLTHAPQNQLTCHQALKTLTLPTEMGEKIKFIGFSKNHATTLRGFAEKRYERLL